MRIAVDAMGGDTGPRVVVPGAIDAAKARPGELKLLLVGREQEIRPLLGDVNPDWVEIVPASENIDMNEAPAQAIRRKKDASISVALRMIREGRADAMVSAGNTGAVVASSLLTIGRLHGISRPAISTLWPNKRSGAVVLDVGANHECTPKNLVQFAVMGSVFAQIHIGVPRPRVGLLNIGEEKSKGNDLVRDSYALLEQDPRIHFVGNVEGRDVFDGAADVVVCDGFVGNVILKFSESMYSFLAHLVRDEIRRGMLAKAGALLMKGAFGNVRSQLDYAEYGGAPLLGVKGVVIISHGKSSPRAIRNALLVAAKSVNADINRRIEEQFNPGIPHAVETG
ncbi:MAG TPA: phosphate acyltransferase PlsX [Candidatus Krumholzibacteria bacterium]|nr:phosphate acyltransferase PlsX [Candidatus Krumholzibacteria bacterium]